MFWESVAHRPRQVIEVDGERVGVIEIDDRPQELYLANLELVARWQGQGLGAEARDAKFLALTPRPARRLVVSIRLARSRCRIGPCGGAIVVSADGFAVSDDPKVACSGLQPVKRCLDVSRRRLD